VHRLSYIVDNALLGTAIGGDSAYAVYWYSVTLNPGDLRTYVTYYGRSTLTTDLRPPLALGVHGPATLSVRDQQYSPDPFDIVATIANTGTAPATDVQLTLNLPPELTLAAGQTATQTVAGGELAVDAEQQLTWQVQATSQTTERVVTYSVTAAATNTAPKTVTRTITLPVLVPVTPPPPPPQQRHGIWLRLNRMMYEIWVVLPAEKHNRVLLCSSLADHHMILRSRAMEQGYQVVRVLW
jgi:hypothetical protein